MTLEDRKRRFDGLFGLGQTQSGDGGQTIPSRQRREHPAAMAQECYICFKITKVVIRLDIKFFIMFAVHLFIVKLV